MESSNTILPAHAKYSPSKLARIIRCPGSVKRCMAYELDHARDESPYAAEGTLLHAFMERALDVWPAPHDIDFLAEARNTTQDLEEAKILAIDWQSAIENTIDYIQNEVMPLGTPDIMYFQELRVFSAVHEDINGTLDLGIITPETCHIVDFKFGKGVKVDIAYGDSINEQLMAYMEGFINMLSTLVNEHPKYANISEFYIHIAQPRIDNYQSLCITREDVEAFKGTLSIMLDELREENPRIEPGATQCRWCTVGALCKDRIQMVQSESRKLFNAQADLDSGLLTIEDATKLLANESQVKAAYSTIRKFLFGAACQNKEVPGYKIVRTNKHRAWIPGTTLDDVVKAVPELDERSDMLIKSSLITPAQAEKLAGSKLKGKLQELIVKPEGDYELVDENDKRDAVPFTGVIDLFNSVEGE